MHFVDAVEEYFVVHQPVGEIEVGIVQEHQ